MKTKVSKVNDKSENKKYQIEWFKYSMNLQILTCRHDYHQTVPSKTTTRKCYNGKEFLH